MPVNEILAPVYLKGKLTNPVYPDGHQFRLYFAAGSSWTPGVTGDEDNWQLQVSGSPVASVANIVNEVFTRLTPVTPEHSHVSQIELWHSVPGAPNVLDHLNTLPLGNDYGSAQQHPSSQLMYIFAGALRQQFRLSVFDGVTPEPQKITLPVPPSGDDGSIQWYILKSPIPFANNDGIRLIVPVSLNRGYNNKLKRTYGRTLAP